MNTEQKALARKTLQIQNETNGLLKKSLIRTNSMIEDLEGINGQMERMIQKMDIILSRKLHDK